MEFMGLPAQNFYTSKCLMKCNYQQALEGSIDTAHLTFLHRSMAPMQKDVFNVGHLQEYGDADGDATLFCEDTEYGMHLCAPGRRRGHLLLAHHAVADARGRAGADSRRPGLQGQPVHPHRR